MKDRLVDWPTVMRHVIVGAIPFVGMVLLYEHFFGEWSLGAVIVILSAILPFVAVGWLGYQHWKHRHDKTNHG